MVAKRVNNQATWPFEIMANRAYATMLLLEEFWDNGIISTIYIDSICLFVIDFLLSW